MKFTKMHGAGNDYIFVDGTEINEDWSKIATLVSDRHFGVGSDGLIVAVKSDIADVRMRMWNADGSESEMCGNGIRCFAKFVVDNHLVSKASRSILVETGAGILPVTLIEKNGEIIRASVEMGVPSLASNGIPIIQTNLGSNDYYFLNKPLIDKLSLNPQDLVFDANLTLGGQHFKLTGVSTGNPHVTCFLDTPIEAFALEQIGPLVENHEAFPNRVNFHIVNILNRGHIRSRTWERGSGQTLACATGATAMVVAARLHDFVDASVVVEVPGGELVVEWDGFGSATMEGPIVEVFSGAF